MLCGSRSENLSIKTTNNMAKQENNRRRISVPVSGLDTSTPDLTVADGKCEELHNLRWETGGWHNIDPLKIKHSLRVPGEDKEWLPKISIIYHHPAAGDDTYIASVPYDDSAIYLLTVIIDNETIYWDYGDVFTERLSSDIRITHFGNILIVMDNTNQQVVHYYLNGGTYEEFQIPQPPVVRQSTILGLEGYGGVDSSNKPITCTGIAKYKTNEVKNGVPFYNISTGVFYIPQISAEYFWGEICFFAAFQMADGSLVSPSALVIAASEPFAAGEQYRKYINFSLKKTIQPGVLYTESVDNEIIVKVKTASGDGDCTPFTFWIRPYITITIPDNLDTNLVKSIIIYSTRINPIWDSEKLNRLNAGITIGNNMIHKYWADNRLPEQPFYFVKSIPIEDFSDSAYNMYLGADLLKDIEQNGAYEPVDAHSLFYDVAKEYNSRLHIGGNAELRLFEGFGDAFFPVSTNPPQYNIITNIRIDNTDYRTTAAATLPLNSYTTFVPNKILSYPDYRATFMYAPVLEEIHTAPYKIDLQPAQTNNFAWATYRDDSELYDNETYRYVKYSSVIFKGMKPASQTIHATATLVPQRNKLRVSAANNPFSFPLANSYAIGTDSNRILGVNSAAIEMSDAKFGEFPLYVFTDEGIFTLQSGSGDILYSATIPLNYDRIVNPETLAVNHNVLYVTARGIMAMFSNESRLISEPLNDLHNTPPLDYLRTAKLYYQPAHNEVIVWNPAQAIGQAAAGTRAYVYSLDGSYWSTRDFYGAKLNTNELFVRLAPGHIQLLNLDEEEAWPDQPVRIRLVTRPLKFGSTEYKRLESMILRLHTPKAYPMQLIVEGSTDLKTWTTMRNTDLSAADRDILLRRFPCSMCYLRVTFEAAVSSRLEFTQFDMEYYLRFLHRLR